MKLMKLMRVILLTVMLTSAAVIMAQKTTVTGVLIDKNLNEGEPYATVRVFKAGKQDKPVAMSLTDENGHFTQEIKGKGLFEIVFSSIGKEDLRQTVEVGKESTLDMGTLYIKDSDTMLKGVEVVAQKPLVKMEVDKMSYNVAEDEDSKSYTVLDMLRKVPMVTVDGQDNITVNGSSSFKVYVNGKPNVMFSSNPSMIFKNMPAIAVKSIEVVTNPGAKYDAEGVGGVLNIVMNGQGGQSAQSINGYNGTIRASAGNKSLGGSVFVSGQQGKLSYSDNIMENYNKPGTTNLYVEQRNGNADILIHSQTETKLPSTMGNLSIGYELDSMSNINATASFNTLNLKNNGHVTSSMNGGAYGTGFGYDYDISLKNKRTSFSGNIDYQRFFNKERNRSLMLTYQLNYNPSEDEQRNDFNSPSTAFLDLTDRYSLNKENTTEHTLQADYTTPIGRGQTLNVGSKLMTRRAKSDALYYLQDVLNESQSMDYLYKNSIIAGYAEYEGKWGQAGAKGGVRYEHTWQNVEYRLGNGEDFTKNYGSLVPSASLSYDLSPGRNMGLTYNMRISRPGISYLNPYVNRTDPTSISYGNTDLDVEKSHNVSLVYNMFTPRLMMNLNLRYSYTGNGIEEYSFINNNVLNTTYGNIVKRQQTGINVYANWLAHKNTRILLNGGVSYTNLKSQEFSVSNNGWQANAMVGLQQTLPWNLKLGAYIITSTKSYTLQGWNSGYNLLTANISKSILNDRLTFSLSGLMGLSDKGNLKIESKSGSTDFAYHQTVNIPLKGFSFSISFNFGNNKRQNKTHESRVQSDYIEQQSQGEMLNSMGSGNTGMPQ